MRVNRRFLYWGVFLVALGGVLVVVDLGAIAPAVIVDVLRLWPLALVAIGLRPRPPTDTLQGPGGMLAAAAPGLLLGAGFAVAPRIAIDCGVATARTDDLAASGPVRRPGAA